MLRATEKCQYELHQWGTANQVAFDKDKEGMFILSRRHSQGARFDLLGIQFDCKLVMADTVEDLAKTCRWKLKAILRTGKFNTGSGLVSLYKAQILSFVEYRTAAIYHACDSALTLLDAVQNKVLTAAGISKVQALIDLNLAPLAVRRDIAMLGLMHRANLGRGPNQFREIFRTDTDARREGRGKHRLQIKLLPNHFSDFVLPGSRPADYIEHSAFGLIRIYNMLPAHIVETSPCVKTFQSALQTLVKNRASGNCDDWEATLSPRVPSSRHPLRGM